MAKRVCFSSRRARAAAAPSAPNVAAVPAAMAAAHEVRPERQQKAAREIVAERDRANERFAARAFGLRQRERGGDHRTARMRFRHRLEVVGLVGVRAHRVRQRPVDRRRAEIRRDDRGVRMSSLFTHKFQSGDPGRHARAGNHRAERVENMVFAFDEDGVR